MKEVLLLDDSQSALSLIGGVVEGLGVGTIRCCTVMEAAAALQRKTPIFALVDLYLLGDRGAHLSNQFIREFLIPASIPYGRVTSAPREVPPDLTGLLVYDKRQIPDDPAAFAREIKFSFDGLI